MSQLSRPFQIALAAMVVLVMAWFVVLRGHKAGTASSPEPGPSAPQSSNYKGSAPGVKGLTSAIAKAHGAVATSQQNAQELQSKSAQASGEASSGAAHSSAGTAKGSTSTHTPSVGGKPHVMSGAAVKPPAKQSREAALQRELSQHKIVLLLFWNPKSSDDREVRSQLHDLSHRSGRVAVHTALPKQVGDFGGFTRGVQILQTPTVLVIDGKGHATTIAGLTDARQVQQAIGDALKGGAGKQQVATLTAWVHGSSRSSYVRRANALCRKPIETVVGQGSSRKALTSFHAYVTDVVNPFAAKLAALSPPTQDRGHIERLLALFKRSERTVEHALTDIGAGHQLAARTGLLEAQAQFDQGVQGLANYGLTACFPGA